MSKKDYVLDGIEHLLFNLTTNDKSKHINKIIPNVVNTLGKLNQAELQTLKNVLTYIDDKYNTSEPFNITDIKEGTEIVIRYYLDQPIFTGKIVSIENNIYRVNVNSGIMEITKDQILRIVN